MNSKSSNPQGRLTPHSYRVIGKILSKPQSGQIHGQKKAATGDAGHPPSSGVYFLKPRQRKHGAVEQKNATTEKISNGSDQLPERQTKGTQHQRRGKTPDTLRVEKKKTRTGENRR